MFRSLSVAILGVGVALVSSSLASPVLAQAGQPVTAADGQAINDQNDRAFGARAQQPSRRVNRADNRQRNRQPTPPTAEENIAAAQAQMAAAGVDCRVTVANLLGVNPEQASMYEATCETGPGYIITASTPPQVADCVLLAGQAEIDRRRDPAAVLGTQCVIPQNTDILRVMTLYAQQAGVPCTVNEGASIGRGSSGNLVYEVGCDGVDGFWLEKAPTGWSKTECTVITSQNGTCRFSTAAEAAATLKTRLAGSDAAACGVVESRYMGANANGSFFEAKCGPDNGVIVRFDTAYAVQQVYPCEIAHVIGGGCRLTVVPPPAPAAEAPATQ